jgi:hypothetical protein
MTVFHYKTPRIPEGRDYMLEINPHYKVRDQSDRLNVIDARWVDTDSGLFIDITTVRKNYSHPQGPGILSCKDGHEYRVSLSRRIIRDPELTLSRKAIYSRYGTLSSRAKHAKSRMDIRRYYQRSTASLL